MKTRTIFLLAIIGMTVAEELPSTFRTCKRSDLNCPADAGTDAIVSIVNGVDSLKIPVIEPLAIDYMSFDKRSGPVSVKQEYYNTKLYGLTKGTSIHNIHIDWDKLILAANIYVPYLKLTADYKVNGTVLENPIWGEGKGKSELYDVEMENEIYFVKFEKDGETYLTATKYLLKFLPKRTTFHLDNLFNGDFILGDEMNKFLNENSDLIMKENGPRFEEAYGETFLKMANNIFNRLPMDKIFSPM